MENGRWKKGYGMNVIIAGGGTGGHIYPGLAIAKALERISHDLRVVFVGTAKGLEAKIIPREGYEIQFIRSEGVVRRGLLRGGLALMKIPVSMIDSVRILRQVRPDIAIGVGGYSSGPVILSAKLMGIPAMIHEQNTLPGLTNRILSRFVDAVAVTYQESMNYFPREKTYLTGNPVREEILQGDRERGYERFSLEKDRFTIFVFGGSRGASRINQAVVEALDFLQGLRDRVQFLHQTGERDLRHVKEVYRLKGFKGTVIPFAHDMADAYAVADLVISRAGATTLAEITACGKAAILVPYPYAAGDHQEINARKLVDIGAAKIVRDSELTGKVLSEMIIHVMNNPDELKKMERLTASLGNPHAIDRILEIIEGLIKKKTGYDSASIRGSILRY